MILGCSKLALGYEAMEVVRSVQGTANDAGAGFILWWWYKATRTGFSERIPQSAMLL